MRKGILKLLYLRIGQVFAAIPYQPYAEAKEKQVLKQG
jgi:hypothetical protein